jgi:chitin disaccharide deacetylase
MNILILRRKPRAHDQSSSAFLENRTHSHPCSQAGGGGFKFFPRQTLDLPKDMKPIILCADDYGVTLSVGAGIRELIATRRLSAVSCMSIAPTWPAEAALLKPLRGRIDVGLHFNLTLGFGRPAPSLNQWLKDSLSGRIKKVTVEREFSDQLNRFESAWGGPPDFIDGHHHVHIFPGIRDLIFRQLVEHYPEAQRPWVRQVNPSLIGHDAPLKALVLQMLSIGFVQAARVAGLTITNGFAGLYSQSAQTNYPDMMIGWLRRARPGTLLMCHPGMVDEQDPEGTGAARVREFNYLRSQDFEVALSNERIVLARFRCR